MATPKHQIHSAWVIGSGIEALIAALCLINDAEVSGNQIHILEVEDQPKAGGNSLSDTATEHAAISERLLSCQDPCVLGLLSKVPDPFHHHDPPSTFNRQRTESQAISIRHPTELFLSKPRNFMCQMDRPHLWRKNRRDMISFLLKHEAIFEGKSIQDIFDDSFFSSGLWELFSSNFGLRPMHCAIEFHRYLCKYLDDVRTDDIHTAGPLQYTLDKSIIQPLKSYLREQGVHFQTDLLVSDIGFRPDSEPRTVYNIQASTNGKPVLLPVAAEDICIVTIGSPASGSSTGTSAAPPPVISAKAETLLGYDWSIWYQLAKKSPKFGNPSTFCTHLSESRLGMFVVGLPPSEFNEIYSRVIHEGSGQRNLVSIAQSNWSLKITFPQHQALVDRSEEKFSFLGYALTPDQPGDFVKKPMCACCGDEILSELLGHLDIPLDHILTKAITIPQLLPLGLSPLLARCRGDRPQVIPLNTTNVALVGQYVEIADETVLSLEYSVRCAQLAVHHLMGLTNTISEVKKSFIAARYGDRV